jgi:dihydrofolate synthase/folylpolyglutamate synthase
LVFWIAQKRVSGEAFSEIPGSKFLFVLVLVLETSDKIEDEDDLLPSIRTWFSASEISEKSRRKKTTGGTSWLLGRPVFFTRRILTEIGDDTTSKPETAFSDSSALGSHVARDSFIFKPVMNAESSDSYRQAIEFLDGLRWFGASLGLANTLKLAELAGHPQRGLRFIHVAGTNGKGSTCAMLESIYRAAGLRVGLFTSPHLVSFRERLQVNRRLIDEADVVRLMEEMRAQLKAFPEGQHPTFFETVTVMALRYFAEQKCELVIWETGLGGRLDATNIVTPLASIITNIGIDHAEWLGDTVEKIAAEKAGIIKTGRPVITGARPAEGLEVIAVTALEKQAPLTIVDESQTNRPPLDGIDLSLHGPHQRFNAAIAAAATRVLAKEIPVSDDARRQGLTTIYWPGRMQPVQRAAGQTVLLDGAHNPAGIEALRIALLAEFPGIRPTVIFGVFRDKDSTSMIHSLSALASRIVLTPVHSDRTEDPARLATVCRAANPAVPIEVCVSLTEALEKTARDPLVVVTGSLYLVGEAMELLHLAPVPSDDEKKLNEWKAARQ